MIKITTIQKNRWAHSEHTHTHTHTHTHRRTGTDREPQQKSEIQHGSPTHVHGRRCLTRRAAFNSAPPASTGLLKAFFAASRYLAAEHVLEVFGSRVQGSEVGVRLGL